MLLLHEFHRRKFLLPDKMRAAERERLAKAAAGGSGEADGEANAPGEWMQPLSPHQVQTHNSRSERHPEERLGISVAGFIWMGRMPGVPHPDYIGNLIIRKHEILLNIVHA